MERRCFACYAFVGGGAVELVLAMLFSVDLSDRLHHQQSKKRMAGAAVNKITINALGLSIPSIIIGIRVIKLPASSYFQAMPRPMIITAIE